MADSADSEGKRRGRRDSPPDGIELSSKQRALIHGFHARLVEMNLFEVLGVDSDADVPTLRRGYHVRSKQFHPDRYFNKNLGHYKKLLEHIFQWVSAAFKFLKDDRKREAYRQRLLGGSPEQQPAPAQPPPRPIEAAPPPVAAPAKPAAPIVVPVQRDSVLEFVIADEDGSFGKPAAATPLPPHRSPTPPPVAQPRSPTPPPVAQPRSPTPPPVSQSRSPTPPPLPTRSPTPPPASQSRSPTPPPVPTRSPTPPPTRPRSVTPPPVDPPAKQARAPADEQTQADNTLEFYVDD
jgi:hypothetical protein